MQLLNGLGGVAGFGVNALMPNDDGSSDEIDITSVFESGLDFFGNNYTSLWVNNNGSVTFAESRYTYTPDIITATTSNPEVSPFWADVDTRGPDPVAPTPGGTSQGTNAVYYALDTVNDRFVVTWDDVGYFSYQSDKVNAFQLILTDQGGGNFGIEFRYEDINWTTGDASGGTGGLGGTVARAGWTAGTGNPDEYFELPQSGNQDAILALETSLGNTGVPGLWSFNVNDGIVNLSPDAVDDRASIVGASADPFAPPGTVSIVIDVLANDTDPEGEDLIVTQASGPTHGSVVINPDSTVTYTVASGFPGPDSFTYTIMDESGGTDTATVTVNGYDSGDSGGGEDPDLGGAFLALSYLMVGTAPEADSPILEVSDEGGSLRDAAREMLSYGDFLSQFGFTSSLQSKINVITAINMGLAPGSEAHTLATAYFIDNLASGVAANVVFERAVTYMLNDTMRHPMFDEAANALRGGGTSLLSNPDEEDGPDVVGVCTTGLDDGADGGLLMA